MENTRTHGVAQLRSRVKFRVTLELCLNPVHGLCAALIERVSSELIYFKSIECCNGFLESVFTEFIIYSRSS